MWSWIKQTSQKMSKVQRIIINQLCRSTFNFPLQNVCHVKMKPKLFSVCISQFHFFWVLLSQCKSPRIYRITVKIYKVCHNGVLVPINDVKIGQTFHLEALNKTHDHNLWICSHTELICSPHRFPLSWNLNKID